MPLKRWELALVLGGVAWALLLLLLVGLGVLGNRDREGILERRLERSLVFAGQEAQIRLLLDTNALPTGGGAFRPRLDVALVLDHSGSMGDGPGSRLDAARRAAQRFVELLDLRQHRVAVVPFTGAATLALLLSDTADGIARTIAAIKGGGDTAIHAGMQVALGELTGPRRRQDAQGAIVLLSDGESNYDAAMAAAITAKQAGLRVVTIALGSDAGRGLLRQMASSPNDYYEGQSPDTLDRIYANIAAEIVDPAAFNVRLTETFDTERLELVPPPPSGKGSPLQWDIPVVGRKPLGVEYIVRASSWGWYHSSPSPGGVSLVTVLGQPISQTAPRGPKLIVMPPLWLLLAPLVLPFLYWLYRLARWLQPRLARLSARRPTGEEPVAPTAVGSVSLSRLPWAKEQELPSFLLPLSPRQKPEMLPTLIVGLGERAEEVLFHIKDGALDMGQGSMPERLRLLHLRLDAQQSPSNTRAGQLAPLSTEEQFILRIDLARFQRTLKGGDTDPAARYPWLAWQELESALDREKELGYDPMRVKSLFAESHRLLERLALAEEERDVSRTLGQALGELQTAAPGSVARVWLMGPLAGWGSGIFCGMGWLIRRAARELGIPCSLYGMLLLAPREVPVPRGESFAVLREVHRFQFHSARLPYAMGPLPSRSPTGPVNPGTKDSVLDCALFDEVFLMPAEARDSAALAPVIANALLMCADASAGVQAYRAWGGMVSQLLELRDRFNEMLVGGLGSFTYYLPMRDLVRGAHLRFVRQVLTQWLQSPEGHEAQVAEQRAQEALERMPGRMQGVEASFYSALARGQQCRWEKGIRRDIAQMALTMAEGEQHAKDSFGEALRIQLAEILAAGLSDHWSGGFALRTCHRFLLQVYQHLATVMEELAAYRAEGDGIEQAIAVVAYWQEASTTLWSLLPGPGEDAGEGPERPVLARLLRRIEELEGEIKQRLVARSATPGACCLSTHMESDSELPLDQVLYQRHLAPQVASALQRLRWALAENGRLQVIVRGVEDVALSQEELVPGVIDALQELALHLAPDVWGLSVLAAVPSHVGGISQEIDQIRRYARPGLQFDRGRAPDRFEGYWCCAPQDHWLVEQMRAALGNLLPNPNHCQTFKTAGSYRFSIVGCTLGPPLSSLTTYDEMRSQYSMAVYGSAVSVAREKVLHVFCAEQNACRMERRLGEVQAAPQPLHPRVVALLEDPEVARSVALAFTYGKIQFRRSDQGYQYFIVDPVGQQIPITDSSDTSGSPYEVLAAISRSVIYGKGPYELTWLASPPGGQEMQKELGRLRDFYEQLERGWDPNRRTRQEVLDCLACFKLILLDEMKGLEQQRSFA